LVPWKSGSDVKIDRFDVRSMLDFIREYDGKAEEWTDEQKQLEVLLNYERYRTIIEAQRRGIEEKEHIVQVDSEIAAKLVYLDASQLDKKEEGNEKETIKKEGAQIGFDYDENEEEDDEEESETESEDSEPEPNQDKPPVLSAEEIEKCANGFCIIGYEDVRDFSVEQEIKKKLRRQQRQQMDDDFKARHKGKQRRDRRRERRKEKEKRVEQQREEREKLRQKERELAGLPPIPTANLSPASSSKEKKKKEKKLMVGTRQFITSFPNPNAVIKDKSLSSSSSSQTSEDPIQALMKPGLAAMQTFFPDLAPVEARDEAMLRMDVDLERKEQGRHQGAQNLDQETDASGKSNKKIKKRSRSKSGSSSPDSLPRAAKIDIRKAKERKMTPAQLLKAKLKNALTVQLSKDVEQQRKMRKEQVRVKQERDEELRVIRRLANIRSPTIDSSDYDFDDIRSTDSHGKNTRSRSCSRSRERSRSNSSKSSKKKKKLTNDLHQIVLKKNK